MNVDLKYRYYVYNGNRVENVDNDIFGVPHDLTSRAFFFYLGFFLGPDSRTIGNCFRVFLSKCISSFVVVNGFVYD
jgi:hypothetical protein